MLAHTRIPQFCHVDIFLSYYIGHSFSVEWFLQGNGGLRICQAGYWPQSDVTLPVAMEVDSHEYKTIFRNGLLKSFFLLAHV